MNLRKDPLTKEAADFLFQIGTEFLKGRNFDTAYKCFSFSLHLNPRFVPAAHNLGVIFTAAKNTEGAVRMFTEAVKMTDYKDILELSALAESLRKAGRNSEASRIIDRMRALDEKNYLTLLQEGMSFYENNDLEAAVHKMEQCLAVKEDDVWAGLNRALISMTSGNWVEYWRDYEKYLTFGGGERSKLKGITQEQTWKGKKIGKDKVLLIVSDQGKGDVFQFSRYMREIKDLCGGQLHFYCQPELSELMGTVDGVDKVVEFKSVASVDYEEIASLLGIMDVLAISPANCYREAPYIFPDRGLEELWGGRIPKGENLRVGLVWAGDPAHGNDSNRSMPLSFFEKILDVPGVDFYSLQVGQASNQVEEYSSRILDISAMFRDFSDTAAALKHIDLLISVDTSVVHLAGAIGHKDVWVLLPCPAEWRWLSRGEETAWYKNMRLFRQPKVKDWSSVEKEVRAALRQKVEELNEIGTVAAQR